MLYIRNIKGRSKWLKKQKGLEPTPLLNLEEENDPVVILNNIKEKRKVDEVKVILYKAVWLKQQ